MGKNGVKTFNIKKGLNLISYCPKNEVREYRKPGGGEQLQKDFDKIKGVSSKAKDGTETKTLLDGTTVVKRPRDGDTPPTLEVQPPKGDLIYPNPKIRVKVRYP